MTGSMLPYKNKLKHYAGHLPLISADYGASECWVGVNIDPCTPPEMVTFTVVPTFAYFEFLPLTRRKLLLHPGGGRRKMISTSCISCSSCTTTSTTDDDDVNDYEFIEAQPVRLSEVEVGREYEVVVTTFTGLYRYRLGDVVRVCGFHDGSPKLSFVCRRKLTLSVNIDKTTEWDVQMAVDKAAAKLLQQLADHAVELIDFTSTADLTHTPGRYIVYWELSREVEPRLLAECCTHMDSSFTDHGYVIARRAGCIGPLELRIVESGSFRRAAELFLKSCNGASMSQLKMPRCAPTDHKLVSTLDSCVTSRFTSTAYTYNHQHQQQQQQQQADRRKRFNIDIDQLNIYHKHGVTTLPLI